MKKLFILFSFAIMLASITGAEAANIVYPKTQTVKINSPVTFFIGNEKPDKILKINDEIVKIHQSGGFYHAVKLNNWKNVFLIDNGTPSDLKTYTIIKPITKDNTKTPNYIEYENTKFYKTKSDNVPIRSFPDDTGFNRLQNLQKNIPLNIIGEQGKYYKIKLARDDYAWIDKNYVTELKEKSIYPADIISYEFEEDDAARKFVVKLSNKQPYVLSETRNFKQDDGGYQPYSDGLDLTIYNVNHQPENKFDFHINSDTNLYGYKSYYNEANELIVYVKKQPIISHSYPLKGLKITLDAGHGGSEYGAIGCLGDKEKDLNLKFVQEMKTALEKAGATVFLTRDSDKEIGLYERVTFSQNNNSDIFISIHLNALPDTLAESNRSGLGVYYYYPQSNNLARTILKTMSKSLSMNNDNVHQESFAVIRNSESLSVLVEIGYIINPEDNAKLINSDFQKKAAQSLVRALENYFNDL